jgi:hypothetical protein
MKLDLGCGKAAIPGFEGADIIDFGQKWLVDLTKPWPWADGSAEEAFSSHFVEHLEPEERVHFANELFRVLRPGATARILVPHWRSHRAYGDMTHKWPPVSESWFNYLNADWRKKNAPHDTRYTCDFKPEWENFGVTKGWIWAPTLPLPDSGLKPLVFYFDELWDLETRITKPEGEGK